MKKILIAAAAAFALLATLAPNNAEARCRWNCVLGIGIGAAVVGTVAANALAPRYRPYAVVQGYDPYPTYVAAYPADCPGGYWARKQLFNQYGQFIGYSKPRFFCPAY
jgi:hypothetical protein